MNPATITDVQSCQAFLQALYRDVNRDQSWEYMHGYLSRSVGYLGKVANATVGERAGDRTVYFVRLISWTCAIASKLQVDLQQAVTKRFPGYCPYCLERQCICFRTDKKPTIQLPAYKLIELTEERRQNYQFTLEQRGSPASLTVVGETIASIYPSNEIVWYYSGPWHHLVKLHEEVSEVHEAASKMEKGEKTIDSVAEELADVLAWTLCAWHITMRPKKIEDAIIDYYWKGCPVCKGNPCTCTPHSTRPSGLVDSHALVLVEERLAELCNLGVAPECAEHLQSIKAARQAGGDTIARSALTQVADWVPRAIKPNSEDRATRERAEFLVNEISRFAKQAL
jgi:NTP pyrophosphatase (non-canonical NTP hydrolase)